MRERSELGTTKTLECRGEIFFSLNFFFASPHVPETMVMLCSLEHGWENISGFMIFVLLVFNSVLV
jgi:hypothetical protein